MRTTLFLVFVAFLLMLAAAGCNASGPTIEAESLASTPTTPEAETQVPTASATPEPAPTSTRTAAPESSPTASPAPSLTPTPSIKPLEIVEWAEYPYANLADPKNTDTRLEILVRNPNDFPVRFDAGEEEIRLLNTAGEIVYTNPNPFLYLWEGSWMQGGETASITACVCFETDGVTRQAWESIELAAAPEAAEGIAYTTDVDVSIGEFFSLEEAHLGGDQLGTEITLVNTSDQVLTGYDVRVIARDASGKYVGVAIWGTFSDHDSSGEYERIEPGNSASGVVVSEIDYVDGPLDYEVMAIGILAEK